MTAPAGWNEAGTLAAVGGSNSFAGTSTVLAGAVFSGDMLVYKDGATVWFSGITANVSTTLGPIITEDNWPTSSGFGSMTIAQGNWAVIPTSPLRNQSSTYVAQLAGIISSYSSVLSLTASDNTVTLNKAASGNNAAVLFNTANVVMGRIGHVGDNNMHLQVSISGGVYTDALVFSQSTALGTVYGDPTSALGIATKQYVDGASVEHGARLAVATGNINTADPGTATFDGVAAANGDVILLLAQTTAAQNGPWVFNGSAVAMTRPAWFATAYVSCMDALRVMEGSTLAGSVWSLGTANPITVGSTALSFVQSGFASVTGTGSLVLSDSPTITGTLTVNGTAGAVMFVNSTNASGTYFRMQNSSTAFADLGSAKNVLSGSLAIGDFALSAVGTAYINVASGKILAFHNNGAEYAQFNSAGHLLIGTTTDSAMLTVDGTGRFNDTLTLAGGMLLATSADLTDGSAAQAATMTNAPVAGNPTKWIPVNDNGTTRYIAAW